MDKLEIFNKITSEIYPLTIIVDRYGGTYSGGNFTAWPYDPWTIDEAVDNDDVSCMTYWSNTEDIVGRGDTVIDAVIDLAKRMKEKYNKFEDIDFDASEDSNTKYRIHQIDTNLPIKDTKTENHIHGCDDCVYVDGCPCDWSRNSPECITSRLELS